MEEKVLEPQEVKEQVEVLMKTGVMVDSKEFMEKLNELTTRYGLMYDRAEVGLVNMDGKGTLVMNGVRKETAAEMKEREEKDTDKKKKLEEHELAEYLKLHKKYGKKRIDE